MKTNRFILFSVVLSAVLLSVPWLVPGTGFLALVALVPLLVAEAAATELGIRHFFLYYYLFFVLWNAITTFWVCNATVGGGIFAILANAFQMAVIFAVFRFCRKRFSGAVPYIFLAVMWIAWERWYFNTQISWPWLTLGHAFAGSTRCVQWYEYTGVLGGSLWIWASNLSIFSLVSSLTEGQWQRSNLIAKVSSLSSLVLILAGPFVLSEIEYRHYEEKNQGTLDVVIGQPNFNPYEKFKSMSQAQQNSILLSQFASVADTSSRALFIAPETFTSDVVLNDMSTGPTVNDFLVFLHNRPAQSILFGASSYRISYAHSSPSILSRPYGQGWIDSYNSALLENASGDIQVYHKSKLVVGTELTPYPQFFVPIDNMLCEWLDMYSVMGRCQTQAEPTVLRFSADIPFGCAVCYESVYGEYCAEFVNKGARFLSVITNDAWWGNTPGYRQHFSYSRLRAIELRRDIARCGNTGISAFIDQRGDVVSSTGWWNRETLSGKVNLNSDKTFFAVHGDVTGRGCTLAFLLLLALLFVKTITTKIKIR